MKAIVVTSGGMDSISMALALLEQGYEVRLLHFDYGQKCEAGEQNAVVEIGLRLQQGGMAVDRVQVVDVSGIFAPVADVTSLISGDRRILSGMESLIASRERAGDDLWVPGRNLVFLSIAATYAEYWGAEAISWGANQSETSYPDNTLAFAERMTDAIQFGCLKPAKIVAPLYGLDKVGILKWGHEYGYGWVYKYTWSCDDAPDEQGRPCGVCGCCMNRRLAHYFAGFEDRQQYANEGYFREEFLPQALRRGDLWYGRYLYGVESG